MRNYISLQTDNSTRFKNRLFYLKLDQCNNNINTIFHDQFIHQHHELISFDYAKYCTTFYVRMINQLSH